MPFWQFFRKGWDGRALLVQPSKSNHSIWKILFVLGSYEYLERLEGTVRDIIFFCVNKSDNYSVNGKLIIFFSGHYFATWSHRWWHYYWRHNSLLLRTINNSGMFSLPDCTARGRNKKLWSDKFLSKSGK